MLPFLQLFENDYDWEMYWDLRQRIAERILNDFLTNPQGHLALQRIPKAALTKVWGEYAKYGREPDPELVDKLCMMMVKGIATLRVCTQLQGHTDDGLGYHEVFDDVFEWSRDEVDARVSEDDLYQYLVVDVGDSPDRSDTIEMLSDYGLRPLESLVGALLNDSLEPVQRLMVLDRALNVIHQRSDLSAFFIEGGKQTLLYIANFIQSSVLDAKQNNGEGNE
jgi:hypothetical protein